MVKRIIVLFVLVFPVSLWAQAQLGYTETEATHHLYVAGSYAHSEFGEVSEGSVILNKKDFGGWRLSMSDITNGMEHGRYFDAEIFYDAFSYTASWAPHLIGELNFTLFLSYQKAVASSDYYQKRLYGGVLVSRKVLDNWYIGVQPGQSWYVTDGELSTFDNVELKIGYEPDIDFVPLTEINMHYYDHVYYFGISLLPVQFAFK